MEIRPIDIARKLNLSTSTLRNYEEQGIVPPAKRASNGYRIYTKEHIAYFECIKAMAPAFGMELTSQVLRKIQSKDVVSALWMVNEAQASLNQDKKFAESTSRFLESEEQDRLDPQKKQELLTIGQVSAKTKIPRSAIRHWENIGLISSSRNERNGYRMFNGPQIRKIFLIKTLRGAIYSLDTVRLKQAIEELDSNDLDGARKIAYESIKHLNNTNQAQLRAGYYLYKLCEIQNLLE